MSTPPNVTEAIARSQAALVAHPRVLLPFLALVLLGFIWGGLHIYAEAERASTERRALESAGELLKTYESHVLRAVREIDQALNFMRYVHEQTHHHQSGGTLAELKARGLLPAPLLFTFAITDEEGRIVEGTRSMGAENVSNQDYFRGARAADALFISTPIPKRAGEWDLVFSRAYKNERGEFGGVVLMAVDASYFVSSYESTDFGERGMLSVIGADGVLRARRSGDNMRAGDRMNLAAVWFLAPDEQNGALAISPIDGVARYTAARWLSGFPLAVVIGVSQQDTFAQFRGKLSVYRLSGALASIIVILSTVVLYRLSKRLADSQQREHAAQLTMMRQAHEQLLERRRLEGQLALTRKLESVGQLAAGVAHEINTPIQYVGDSVFFLETAFQQLEELRQRYREAIDRACEGAPAAEVRALIAAAEEQADLEFNHEEIPRAFVRTQEGVTRVTKIVRAMKEFSHQGRDEFSPADINQAIESTIEVARGEYKYVAEMVVDLQPLPAVTCNVSGLNQVVLNMIVNAAHAIRESGKDASSGRIGVRTRTDGDFIEIAIEDNGCGIPAEIADRVYDPFFTTKEVGKGTGQGLSIAHRIVVTQHGGKLDFRSQVGRGTTFFIHLPINGPPPAASARKAVA